MKPIYANALKIALIIMVGITFFIISTLHDRKEKRKMLLFLGDLKFSGKIINSSVYDYGGRHYRLVCIKLDTCNRKYLYIFNDLFALKIKDSIATMSAGADYLVSPISYIALDAKRNILIYRYKNKQADTSEVDIQACGLTEAQMNFCNGKN